MVLRRMQSKADGSEMGARDPNQMHSSNRQSSIGLGARHRRFRARIIRRGEDTGTHTKCVGGSAGESAAGPSRLEGGQKLHAPLQEAIAVRRGSCRHGLSCP